MPVGGPRQFTGSGLGQIAGWQCPACGADNAGPLEVGCQLCGSGQPGAHVGQPPSAAAEAPPILGPASKLVAFEAWFKANTEIEMIPSVRDPRGMHYFLWVGFRAGWNGRDRTMDAHVSSPPANSVPVLGTVPSLPFPVEGKVAHTVAAALEMFVDQVLLYDLTPEEAASNEWCSVEEARALIAQLEAHTK